MYSRVLNAFVVLLAPVLKSIKAGRPPSVEVKKPMLRNTFARTSHTFSKMAESAYPKSKLNSVNRLKNRGTHTFFHITYSEEFKDADISRKLRLQNHSRHRQQVPRSPCLLRPRPIRALPYHPSNDRPNGLIPRPLSWSRLKPRLLSPRLR